MHPTAREIQRAAGDAEALARQESRTVQMTKHKKKVERPALRKNWIRHDATIGRAEREVERVIGLPRGCVRLVLPGGRKARTDKLVGSLLTDWGVD